MIKYFSVNIILRVFINLYKDHIFELVYVGDREGEGGREIGIRL